MTTADLIDPGLEVRLAQRRRPPGRTAMFHSWQELLFVHWSFDPAEIQRSLPEGLFVDTHEGRAWVGIVPFFMRSIRPWWSPALPGVSNFQELNLRTYVCDERGVPGVWFYSLDCNSRLAVRWGRGFYRLPYFLAKMTHTRQPSTGRVEFTSQRRCTDPRTTSRFVYRVAGGASLAEPGSLEFFLVERYVLFARLRSGRLSRGIVHHPPYEISPARLDDCDEHLFALSGLPAPRREPEHAVCCQGVDVEVFPLLEAQ